jgi:hypothetical protein
MPGCAADLSLPPAHRGLYRGVDRFNRYRLLEVNGDLPPIELEQAHHRQASGFAGAESSTRRVSGLAGGDSLGRRQELVRMTSRWVARVIAT